MLFHKLIKVINCYHVTIVLQYSKNCVHFEYVQVSKLHLHFEMKEIPRECTESVYFVVITW